MICAIKILRAALRKRRQLTTMQKGRIRLSPLENTRNARVLIKISQSIMMHIINQATKVCLILIFL
jgi:hypothetical protein